VSSPAAQRRWKGVGQLTRRGFVLHTHWDSWPAPLRDFCPGDLPEPDGTRIARSRTALSIRGATGFTLLEVLTGLTVAALTLAIGFATLAFLYDSREPVDGAAALALQGANTRTLICRWLGESRLRARDGGGAFFHGVNREEDGLPSDEIVFPTTAATPLGVRRTVVRLYIDRDMGTPQRGLVAELTERFTDQPHLVELVPEAGTLDIRYLFPLRGGGGEWVDSWAPGMDHLPRAVELVLGSTPPDTLPTVLRYPIRVVLEAVR
jgi:hypothetical protein